MTEYWAQEVDTETGIGEGDALVVLMLAELVGQSKSAGHDTVCVNVAVLFDFAYLHIPRL